MVANNLIGHNQIKAKYDANGNCKKDERSVLPNVCKNPPALAIGSNSNINNFQRSEWSNFSDNYLIRGQNGKEKLAFAISAPRLNTDGFTAHRCK